MMRAGTYSKNIKHIEEAKGTILSNVPDGRHPYLREALAIALDCMDLQIERLKEEKNDSIQ